MTGGHRLRRLLVLLVSLAAVAVASGCVRMPQAGPVVEADADGNAAVDQPPFIDPRPPRSGDLPREVVKGFLDAMTAFPTDLSVARQFLTEEARLAWDPQRETITYAEASAPRGVPPRFTVSLAGGHVLDSRGAWNGRLRPADRDLVFSVLRDAEGEWRIAEAPDALVVPESWFEQRYRQVSVYFFDPAGRTLVPEPVFVPRGEQLATTLTEALLQGPGADLADISRSFIPPGLTVGVSVPVSPDGVADIALTGETDQQTAQAVDLMLAQFAWTLRQDPGIRALRVTIGGQPVRVPDSTSSQVSVSHGGAYDPVGSSSTNLFALAKGLLISGPPDNLTKVDGPLGAAAYALSQVAVNIDGSEAVAVSERRDALVRASVRGPDDEVRQVLSGATQLLRPVWDLSGRVWVVDRTSAGARVSYLRGDRVGTLSVPGVSGRDVRDFLVSRDGSRFVAVVRRPSGGDALVVSRVRHDQQGRVLGATRAEQISTRSDGLLVVRDIGWSSPTTIAVLLALTDKISSVRTFSVDGSPPGQESLSTTLQGRVRGLVSSPAPGQSVYAVTPGLLLDLTTPTRGNVPVDRGVTSLGYAG